MLGKAYLQPRQKISEKIIAVNTGQHVKIQGIQRMILKYSDGNSRPRPRHIEIAHSTDMVRVAKLTKYCLPDSVRGGLPYSYVHWR